MRIFHPTFTKPHCSKVPLNHHHWDPSQWRKVRSRNPKPERQRCAQWAPIYPANPTLIFSSTQRKQTGSRVIKPKKTALIKKEQMKKVIEVFYILECTANASLSQKHSAGLTAVTEKSLASKAGHLEMLHGGKKDKLKEIAAKKPKAGK
jgi:hypothetical protein